MKAQQNSEIGETKLKSYFSNEYGFIRLEYSLLNNLSVNLWLADFKTGKEFNDTRNIFQNEAIYQTIRKTVANNAYKT